MSEDETRLPFPVEAVRVCRRCPAFGKDSKGNACVATPDFKEIPSDFIGRPDFCPVDETHYLVVSGRALYLMEVRINGVHIQRLA